VHGRLILGQVLGLGLTGSAPGSSPYGSGSWPWVLMKHHLRCTDVIIAANICRNIKKVTTLMTAGPLWIHLRINLVWAYPSRAPTPKCPESGGRTERQTDHSVESKSALIQLAQCQFPQPAISNAKILIYLSEKNIYRSNFIKQHSETVTVWNYENAGCSLRKKIIVSFITILGTLSLPTQPTRVKQRPRQMTVSAVWHRWCHSLHNTTNQS